MKLIDRQESEKLLSIGLELGAYKIRLAQNDQDRDNVFKMRYMVFNEELGEGIPENAATQRDIDHFDTFCDHLIVERDNVPIGTYRLLHGQKSIASGGFYSETEFTLRNLPINFNDAVEMGRACVLPEHRKTATLICLLCGVRHYSNLKDAKYLFGLTSLAKMSHGDALATYEQVQKLGLLTHYKGVEPLDVMKVPAGTVSSQNPQIPALLSVYFEIGAKVCAMPAYDPIFQCHDLLTLIDIEAIPEKTWIFFQKFIKRQAREEKREDPTKK